MSSYDRHELKITRRGVSVKKVIAAYKHFGSLRLAASACGISKDTVQNILRRFNVERSKAVLPRKASYNPKNLYSTFAKWHQAHASDTNLPNSPKALADMAGVNSNVVHCYFRRRRAAARKILFSLPDLRKLDLILEDIEHDIIMPKFFVQYVYAIDRYSQRAAIQGKLKDGREVTVLIPSIEQFASRVRKAVG